MNQYADTKLKVSHATPEAIKEYVFLGLSCSSLDAPGNGSLNSNATSFLSRVTLACDAGYTLYPFDDETLQCVVDTSSSRSAVKWDRDDPKCGG